MEEVHPPQVGGEKSSEFPVKSTTFTKEIAGNETDLLFSRFSDRLLVIITQIGKPGTFLEVSKSKVNENKVVYTTNLLLGKDSEDYELIARAIAEQLAPDQPIVLALGFKVQLTPDIVKEIVQFVKSKY